MEAEIMAAQTQPGGFVWGREERKRHTQKAA